MSDPQNDPCPPKDIWLTIVGLGEDGLSGLPDASRKALKQAEVIFGGPRHLDLVNAGNRGRAWPLPFSVEPVLDLRGQQVVVLASGDPFWHGVGGSLAKHLTAGEWRSLPAPSCMSLAAAKLGWRLENTLTLGLHAAPFEKLVPSMAPGQKALCTLRDEDSPRALASWLGDRGFGDTMMTVLEAMGGPRERVRTATANAFDLTDITTPVVVALDFAGGPGMSQSAGREPDQFTHDGQITKGPMRALTLAALAPQPGEHLWDIGAGSGSVSIEWMLAAKDSTSTAIEPRADRCDNIRINAANFGLAAQITVINGSAPDALDDLPAPSAVFIGGGANQDLLAKLWHLIPTGTRLVANAVTLDSQALLTTWHGQHGGQLLRIDLAQAVPLGRMQGWQHARGQLQWSVTR